jgi:prevent-host-death family protein
MLNQSVNLYEAKTQLSKLVDRAAKGEEIVIAKAGKPMARLVAIEQKGKHSSLWALAGQNTGQVTYISSDFDAEDPEINEMFYGDHPNDPLLKL